MVIQFPFDTFNSCLDFCSVPMMVITITTLSITFILLCIIIFNKRLHSLQAYIMGNILIASSIQCITLQFIGIGHSLYQEFLIWSLLAQSILIMILTALAYAIANQNDVLHRNSTLIVPLLLFIGNIIPLFISLINKFFLNHSKDIYSIFFAIICFNMLLSFFYMIKIFLVKYKDNWIKTYVKKMIIFNFIEMIFCIISIFGSFTLLEKDNTIRTIYLIFFACKGILFSITLLLFPPMIKALRVIFCCNPIPEEQDIEMMKSFTMTLQN